MRNVGCYKPFSLQKSTLSKTIDFRKALRDATIIQDGRGLYNLLVN